jgi:hypothetical protein
MVCPKCRTNSKITIQAKENDDTSWYIMRFWGLPCWNPAWVWIKGTKQSTFQFFCAHCPGVPKWTQETSGAEVGSSQENKRVVPVQSFVTTKTKLPSGVQTQWIILDL